MVLKGQIARKKYIYNKFKKTERPREFNAHYALRNTMESTIK